MRDLAWRLINDAAVDAGLATTAVMAKPERQSKVLLPLPRLEIETIGESFNHAPDLFAKLPAADPRFITRRTRTHVRTLKARVVYRAKTEEAVEAFLLAFLRALPGKAADDGNNLVKIRPERAERGGFEYRLAEPLPERDAAIWITFSGGIYEDTDVPLVRQFNLVDPTISRE